MRSTSLRAQKSKTVNESLAPEPWQLIRTARLPLSKQRGGPPASLQRALEKYSSYMQARHYKAPWPVFLPLTPHPSPPPLPSPPLTPYLPSPHLPPYLPLTLAPRP